VVCNTVNCENLQFMFLCVLRFICISFIHFLGFSLSFFLTVEHNSTATCFCITLLARNRTVLTWLHSCTVHKTNGLAFCSILGSQTGSARLDAASC
jgi:hypothetical protein